MTDTNGTLGKYGSSFQEHLVYLLLTDKPFAEEMYEILDIDYIDLDHTKHIAKEFFNYKTKYNTFPSVKIFRAILKDNKDINPSLYEKTQKFFTTKFSAGDSDFVKEKSTDFCRVQKIKGALIDIIDMLKKPNIENSYTEIEYAIKNALKFGSDKDIGIMYNNEKLLADRVDSGVRNTISTGWHLIDDILGGGVGKGEMIVFLGGTGAGKSHILVNLGSNVVKSGGTVLHYTLELSEQLTALRYDSNLSDISINHLKERKSEVTRAIRNIPGNLIVKEFPTKSVNFGALKNHYMKARSVIGIEPTLVIIDYADLIKPGRINERRIELESIYEEIRGFAMEMKIPVATASQVHRAAIEEEVITIGSISESFAKVMVSDIVISLSRRSQDKVLGKGKLFVAKSRVGPDGIVFPISLDTSRSKIQIFPSN